MTTELAPLSGSNQVSQSKPPLPESPNEPRFAQPQHVLVQLALKIELPIEGISSFKSSGAIVISLTPA